MGVWSRQDDKTTDYQHHTKNFKSGERHEAESEEAAVDRDAGLDGEKKKLKRE